MEFMFNEQMSLIESVQTQSRIIEAMLKASEMEKQYRAQGYSEAQIRQFHEGVTDWAKEKWQGAKDWTREKKNAAGKFIDQAGGVWGAVKKLASMFITWCKKVVIRLMNVFRSDENLVKKYKGLLMANASELNDVEFKDVRPSDVFMASGYDNVKKYDANQTYDHWRQETDNIKDYKVEYVNRSVKNIGGVSGLIKAFEDLQPKDKFKESMAQAQKVAQSEAEAASKDSDNNKAATAKMYLTYLKTISNFSLKSHAARHSCLRNAIIKCVAACKKKEAPEENKEKVTKEAAMYIEQSTIEMNYMVESLIFESEQVDQIIASGIGTQNGMGITDVNLAGQDLGAGSTDPNHLVYDDDLYSQDVEMGDENIAGTIDIDPFDTETHVASGNPVKAMESGMREIIGMLNY